MIPSRATPLQSFLADPRRAALAALLIYLAFNLLLPLIPLPRHRGAAFLGILVRLSTAAFMFLQVWMAQTVVNLRMRPVIAALLMVVFAALGFAAYQFVPAHLHRTLLMGVSITLGCACLGILIAPIIREPNVLLPVALVSMPIDILGAMTPIGFTQNVVAHNPGLVQNLSVPVPSFGGGLHGGIHAIGFIGPGDALFMAFFFAVVLRLQMNTRGTFWLMYALLTATMLIVLVEGYNIAALVPMGLAILLANSRYFKLKRAEVFATIYAGGMILVLVTCFYLYSHSHLYRSNSKGNPDAARNPARLAPGRPAGN